MTDELKKPVRELNEAQRVGAVLKEKFYPTDTRTVPAKSLLDVVRKLDLGAPIPNRDFTHAFDDLRLAFSPDEIATGDLEPRRYATVPVGWRSDMENAPRGGEPFLAWWPWCDYGDGVMEAHFDRAWFDPNGNLKTLGDCFGSPMPYSPTHWREVSPPAALNKGEG